jgi:hypothetical protein
VKAATFPGGNVEKKVSANTHSVGSAVKIVNFYFHEEFTLISNKFEKFLSKQKYKKKLRRFDYPGAAEALMSQ